MALQLKETARTIKIKGITIRDSHSLERHKTHPTDKIATVANY